MVESSAKPEIAMDYLVKYVLLAILIEKNQLKPRKLNYENFRNR